jgi:hypothetical protein
MKHLGIWSETTLSQYKVTTKSNSKIKKVMVKSNSKHRKCYDKVPSLFICSKKGKKTAGKMMVKSTIEK